MFLGMSANTPLATAAQARDEVVGVASQPQNDKYSRRTLQVKASIQSNGTLDEATGISSVTRDGTGIYTFNFSESFTTNKFTAVANAASGSNFVKIDAKAVNNVRVYTYAPGGPTLTDAYVDLMVSGRLN